MLSLNEFKKHKPSELFVREGVSIWKAQLIRRDVAIIITIYRTPCARRLGPSSTKPTQMPLACGEPRAALECPQQPRIDISTTRRISLRRSPRKASENSPAAMETGATDSDPLPAVGLAYVDFAFQKRGLFRLMFGPILVERQNTRAE